MNCHPFMGCSLPRDHNVLCRVMTGATVVYYLTIFYVTGRLHPSPMVRDHPQVAAVEWVFGLAAYIVLAGGKTPLFYLFIFIWPCPSHAFRVCHIFGDIRSFCPSHLIRQSFCSSHWVRRSLDPHIEPVIAELSSSCPKIWQMCSRLHSFYVPPK